MIEKMKSAVWYE